MWSRSVAVSSGWRSGRTLFVVTDAQTLDSWPSLHDDVQRLTEALAMAELVDRSTDVDVSSGPLYQLLRHSLDALAETASPAAIRWWFTLRFLDQQGYRPELEGLRPLPNRAGAGRQRLCRRRWAASSVRAVTERVTGSACHRPCFDCYAI